MLRADGAVCACTCECALVGMCWCMHTYTRKRTYTHMYYISAHTHLQMQSAKVTIKNAHACLDLHTATHAHAHIHTEVYAHASINAHIHTYIHVYIRRARLRQMPRSKRTSRRGSTRDRPASRLRRQVAFLCMHMFFNWKEIGPPWDQETNRDCWDEGKHARESETPEFVALYPDHGTATPTRDAPRNGASSLSCNDTTWTLRLCLASYFIQHARVPATCHAGKDSCIKLL